MIKILFSLFIFISFLHSNNILNESLLLDKTETLTSLEEKIYDNFQYKVVYRFKSTLFNKKKPLQHLNDFYNINDMYQNIFQDIGVILSSNTKTKKIYIDLIHKYKVDFSDNWLIVETEKELEKNFNHMYFKINGNSIITFGTKKDINEIKPLMDKLSTLSNQKLNIKFEIVDYLTNSEEDKFIGYIKLDPFYDYNKNHRILETSMKHNEIFYISFEDVMIEVKLDMINNLLIFDKKYLLFLDKNNLGFIFTDNDNQKHIITPKLYY